MKRRKKSPESTPAEPQAPLQPAYFDAEPKEAEPPAPSKAAERETRPVVVEKQAEQPSPGSESQVSSTTDEASRRKRRRRGGRGRRPATRQSAGAKPGVAAAQPDVGAERSEPRALPEEVVPAAQGAPAATSPRPASARTPRGVVVLAIGLPGSGKSSWFKRHNITPLSSDLLRALLFDDPTEQRFQDLIFSNLRSMLKARLIARRPMNYVDATNLTPHERHSWIKLAKDYGYEVQSVFFDVPLDVCLERNQRRQRVVSDDVMRRMAGKLRPPTFEEGFSKITVVRVKPKEQAG